MKLLVVAGLLGILSPAFAQQEESSSASAYAFSGPCESQGVWTRNALTHTNEIKQVLNRMKDNPACQSIKTNIIASFDQIEQRLREVEQYNGKTDSQTTRLAQLPQEISALRSFSRENSAFRSNVLDLLLGKTITQSHLSSKKVNGENLDAGQMAQSLSDFAKRSGAAATSGLQIFNSTISSFQQAQAQCLDDKEGVIGASIMSGMVKVLSSFASSGQASVGGTQLANSVANLSQYLSRDKKYVDALRSINDREFISSMSCLLEVTTHNYCANLDGQYLFQEIMNSQSFKKQEFTNQKTGKKDFKIVGVNQNFEKRLSEGPLAGYYILSRQVPVVTNWIQKVQYGITPQLPTEADFQIGVSTNTYQHFNTTKQIEGTFNFQKNLLGAFKDFKAQQTYVLEMLESVAGSMIGQGGFGGKTENFFAKVSTPAEIYFRLLGIPVPPAVLGQGTASETLFINNASGWLQANYRRMPIFSDPIKLSETISLNMQSIFRDATAQAIAYYNKYFIVDKIQVVNDSLLGLDTNVRDALINIDQYLKNLELKVKNSNSDPTIYASIQDTRIRISSVLINYKKIRDYSLSIIAKTKNDPELKNLNEKELNDQLRVLGDQLLQKVYLEFEILTARTGWLSNRMASFVMQDYTMSLRNRDQFDPYFEDLMLATGYNTLNLMMNMSESGYSEIKTDLDSAMNINKKNIDSLEHVIRGVFVRNIFDLKLYSMNKEITDIEKQKMVYKMAEDVHKAQVPGEESNAFQRFTRAKIGSMWSDLTSKDADDFGGMSLSGKLLAPVKAFSQWITGTRGNIVVSPVSSFETASGEMSKLCAQTLAFSNLRPYWALCENTTLYSPMMRNDSKDAEVQEILETYLSVPFKKVAYENIEPSKRGTPEYNLSKNYESRICAVRNYHRRNEIARITSAMRQNGDTYENSFTDAVEEMPKDPLPPVQPDVDNGSNGSDGSFDDNGTN